MKAWRHWSGWFVAAGLVLGVGVGGSALARVADEERVYRQEALAHAGAVASAYRHLEEHILLRSTAITFWAGSDPPASTGWLPVWTQRGVQARYCDDVLLVYLQPARLKGVGEDHRSVHVAPFAYVPDGNEGQFPALHWLEPPVAAGGAARPDVNLPACMTGDPLPSGRAALAGIVEDPFASAHMTVGVTHELETRTCPAGFHGPGQRFAREISQQETGRGDPVAGTRVEGTWQLIADGCRADYQEAEHFTVECRWAAGPPHNRVMTGEEIWRRLKSVTAAGTTYGAPVFVSTSCWTQVAGVHPTATIVETDRTQRMTVACPDGFTGTRQLERIVTRRSTKFPWDASPVVTERATPWRETSENCREPADDDSADGDGDGDADDRNGPGEPAIATSAESAAAMGIAGLGPGGGNSGGNSGGNGGGNSGGGNGGGTGAGPGGSVGGQGTGS